ncbi:MAG: Gfo/Idh/MocA family oxidoreductase [Lachnospiraceae bacterium]
MEKVCYGLIGSGWRAEFYIRIAKLVPERFTLTAVLIRDKEKGRKFADQFGVKVVNTLEELTKDRIDFVVLAIKRGFVSDYLEALFKKQIPVLSETPPGESLEALIHLWNAFEKYNGRIQVAEQYAYQPLYAAYQNVISSGKIGEVENISISSLHGYHGVSMIRKYLGTGFQNCTLRGKRYWFDVTETYGREGMVFDGEIVSCSRDRLTMEFENGKVAFFDFSDPAQYHSFIRTRQINIQGVRGEIDDRTIRYLTKNHRPVTQELNRIDRGVYHNQEWSHYGIMLGEELLYQTPFMNARLNDDEIAVATCLLRMYDYVKTDTDFYSLKDALQDMYLCLKMEEAYANPYQATVTETPCWAQ